MNAIDAIGVALVGIGTLPMAAGLARLALDALFHCLERRERGEPGELRSFETAGGAVVVG